MLKVPYGQDAYSVIGKYIRDHITAIEDIIAVIEIDNITTNQLFMADMNEEDYFIWNNDWYEGEKDVALIDFFPVSEAINSSAQPELCEDVVSRKDCLNALSHMMDTDGFRDGWAVSRANVECMLKSMPLAQPEIIRCKKCEHWDKSWTSDWKLNCHYCPMIDRMCDENWYCAGAERRTDA